MIQSLERAFQILELLNAADRRGGRLGAQAVSDAVGLKFPTTHNLLRSLVDLGYADQDPATRKYGLGDSARALGGGPTARDRLVAAARPVVERLARDWDETVLVAMHHPQGRIVVLQQESTQELKVSSTVGVPLNELYARPTGRILLAQLEEREVRAYWDSHGAAGAVWPEADALPHLLTALAQVRAAGALSLVTGGSAGVAAPISIPAQGIRAALGCALPTNRAGAARRRDIEKGLVTAAADIVATLTRT